MAVGSAVHMDAATTAEGTGMGFSAPGSTKGELNEIEDDVALRRHDWAVAALLVAGGISATNSGDSPRIGWVLNSVLMVARPASEAAAEEETNGVSSLPRFAIAPASDPLAGGAGETTAPTESCSQLLTAPTRAAIS